MTYTEEVVIGKFNPHEAYLEQEWRGKISSPLDDGPEWMNDGTGDDNLSKGRKTSKNDTWGEMIAYGLTWHRRRLIEKVSDSGVSI